MGNAESAYDEDDFVHQPRSYAGGSTDYGHQPPSYAGSSTDYGHQPRPYVGSSMDPDHQPLSHTGSSISHGPLLPSYAGSSREHNYQHPMHPKRIADNFSSLDQVISALREAGLESSNLILGVDFTKSNEWTGRYSFNRKSLHAIGNTPNPYEQAISIIGRTLSPFDEDNLIPCFGFGDATTHDKHVFSFYPNQRYCHGFEEALARYRVIVPLLKLSGPTSFAPIIDAAIDIVEASNRQYHVLVIIADGQVTRNPDTPPGSFSPQEQETINSIVAASHHPLSIILVGVGDGPWDSMQQFDDNIPHRSFDNFQFVNFTKIMSENTDISKKETAFALAALMEIPHQYKATLSLPPVNEDFVTGPHTRPLPPPHNVIDHDNAVKFVPPMPNSDTVGPTAPAEPVCPICLTNPKDMAFGCGHTTCKDCGTTLSTCPMCRQQITTRLRLYT